MSTDFEASEKGDFSVLVVEDNYGDQRLATLALQEGARESGESCRVRIAENLKQAEAFLEGEEASLLDVVLLDLGLPDAIGFEALNRFSAVRPDVPVIILTGLSDTEAARDALRFGAADYLEKGDLRPRSLWRAVSYAINRKKLEADLYSLATSDPLTGLKNRRAFFEELARSLEQARRSDLCCAIMVIDIDHFKRVNDVYGHHTGDELLRTLASLLTAKLRRTDTVGRLGGDEFAVIAPNLKSPSGAIEIAEKIVTALKRVKKIDKVELAPSISIGIAVFPGDDGDPEAILSRADLAMYKAKKIRGPSVCFYDQELHSLVRHRHSLKTAMFGSNKASRFYLNYQPIVDARSYDTVGVEGLARWKDRNGKVVMPGEFIPIAEESGWISSLGLQLIDSACLFLQRCMRDGVPIVPISINVSPIQCRDEALPLHVTGKLLKYEIEPELINIEITESTFMQNIDVARRSLQALRDAGVGIHIDDFGTGHSSLSLLKDLPFNNLKIDRSFVSKIIQDPGTRRITEAISELSATLQFKTVAEGVETREQAELLADIGIDYLQGYFFARPLSTSQLKKWLVSDGAKHPAVDGDAPHLGEIAAS